MSLSVHNALGNNEIHSHVLSSIAWKRCIPARRAVLSFVDCSDWHPCRIVRQPKGEADAQWPPRRLAAFLASGASGGRRPAVVTYIHAALCLRRRPYAGTALCSSVVFT